MNAKKDSDPSVFVVVLNWNGKHDTIECLSSLNQTSYPNCTVVVVDNASSDDSVTAILSAHPTIQLLQTGSNKGYAGGNNEGIRFALEKGAEYILLLNNDTIVDKDLILNLVTATEKLPHNSILGPKIYYHSAQDRIWFAGAKWNHSTHSFMHLGHSEVDEGQHSEIREIDYVTGCAMFAPASAFRSVGELDEKLFLTYEETDWCYRARAKDYHCFFIPNAKLWHKVSVSFGGERSPLVEYFEFRNKLLWVQRHTDFKTRFAVFRDSFRTVKDILVPPFVQNGVQLLSPRNLAWTGATWIKTLRRNLSDPYNRARLLGFRDYLLCRFGNCSPQVRRTTRRTQGEERE